ncbi:MAG: SufD family Fe-S cluster assembly protein [Oscillospiraceae bacterium]|nr:SufD family Fe-S cluster assembly protein [Oscillospiraceae bacterium]
MLNEIQKQILAVVSGMAEGAQGAVNIRADGKKAYRSNTPNVRIESKTDKEGIDIFVEPHTVADHVYIPVVITEEGFHDVVYNDFYIGEGAKVTINAGCGIHNCSGCDSEHDGIHTFHIGKNAQVTYSEVHYGDGEGEGKRILNPQTILYLDEGAKVTLETTQIRGVDDTKRYTKAVLSGPNAEFIVQEKLLTHDNQVAESEMDIILDGENCRTRVISRSVAQDQSTQIFYPRVVGNCACFGHVQCDSIIMGKAKVRSIPEISCNHVDAGLVHEAAIGKIAGDQILKLQTLGLSYEEAEAKILEGFLR